MIAAIHPIILEHEKQRADLCIAKASLNNNYIASTEVCSLFERWSEAPSRFFFFTIDNQCYCGQKLLSPLAGQYGSSSLFCSHIKVEMIAGRVMQTQTSETGVTIFYQDISAQQRHNLFDKLMANCLIDIYFPFPQLSSKDYTEIKSQTTGWRVTDEIELFLSLGEIEQRKISIELIMNDKQVSPVIYDPACSTGHFLHEIKKAIPDATIIGQDLSEAMCERARPLLDHVICGDAIRPGMPKWSCDYLFFRFLNAEVVSIAASIKLFEAIIPCLKPTGKAVIFGFTPVLIPLAYLIQRGFTIERCNVALSEKNAIIQYYVLRPNTKFQT